MSKGEYLELKSLYDGKLQEAQAAMERLREEMGACSRTARVEPIGSSSLRNTGT